LIDIDRRRLGDKRPRQKENRKGPPTRTSNKPTNRANAAPKNLPKKRIPATDAAAKHNAFGSLRQRFATL